MQRQEMNGARLARLCSTLTLMVATVLGSSSAKAEQPPPPCHPNPTAAADEAAVRGRGDIAKLPGELQDWLAQLANRPHTYLPLQVFNEADAASQLFQYYLLDTNGFEPNVFTAIIPGVNDGALVQMAATDQLHWRAELAEVVDGQAEGGSGAVRGSPLRPRSHHPVRARQVRAVSGPRHR